MCVDATVLCDNEGRVMGVKEACGVFGVYVPGMRVANLTFDGLFALQHRGQESAGMAVSDGDTVTVVKDMGLVATVFDERTLSGLDGHLAIGHTRYSTHGASDWAGAQPVYRPVGRAGFALGHNGNLTNTAALAEKVGMLPGSVATDSDVVAELLAHSFPETEDLATALQAVLPILEGAFSFVLMSSERLFGVRDPFGFRPLCLGRLGSADVPTGWVLASETPAFSVIGATFVREVAPGELVVVDAEGPQSLEVPWLRDVEPRLCIFEFAYIARPDSRLYGREVHETRCRMGELLALQAPAQADMVMGVPESGVPAAEGFARASGIPYGQGLVKNRYIGRSFIAPGQQNRGRRGPAQAEPVERRHRGQATGRRGRLHRAGHDAALGDPHAARGGRGRGAPAHLLAAVALALLLRDRHTLARGAPGHPPHRRRDGADLGGRLPGLHQHRKPEGCDRRRRRVLRCLLHRRLPHAHPRPGRDSGRTGPARAGCGHRAPGRPPRSLSRGSGRRHLRRRRCGHRRG